MIGNQGKILETIYTANGTLYKDTIVKIIQSENGNLRVEDDAGKMWFVKKTLIVEIKGKII